MRTEVRISTNLINLSVLEWAIEKRGLDLDKIAKRIGIKKEKLKSLLDGKETDITYRQFNNIAEALHIPYGYLFLKSLPERPSINIPDLRKAKKHMPLTYFFFEIYSDVKMKQEWLKQKRIKNDFPILDFIGKFSVKNDPVQIASDIKEKLGISDSEISEGGTDERTLLKLIDKVEKIGIIVFKNSILVNNTHIKLNPAEFRGFTIVDEIAPVIFINSADGVRAQIFTLFHETAHIWIGKSAVSDADFDNQDETEKLCNLVAVEILMPKEKILENWDKSLEPIENINIISKKYYISKLAISYRALNLNLITKDEHESIKEALKKEQSEIVKKEKGGDYYKNLTVRNSKTFTKEVINSLKSGEILYKEAAQLLNVKNLKILHELIKQRL